MTPTIQSPGNGADVDELLQTLSNPFRREIISYFENRPAEATSLDDLVVHIENQHPSKTSDEAWRALDQVHLPSLENRGWLEYDPDRGMVSYHGQQEVKELLGEVYAIFEE